MPRYATHANYLRERLEEMPPLVHVGRLLLTAEVTLGESAAANPEYVDFHCVTEAGC